MAQSNKVLIIEDSHLMRLQVKHALEQANIELLELDSAENLFLENWRFKDIGLILLDINLPEMDGLTVLSKMGEDKSGKWPPVIILSSTADTGTIKRAIMLGAKDYMVKPFNAAMLVQKIQNVLSNPAAPSFRQRYPDIVQVAKEAYETYVTGGGKEFPKDTVAVLFKECENIVHNAETAILFQEEFDTTDYSFRHSVNVAVLSGIIAKWMGLKEKAIMESILAGLLHDVGKARMPRELIMQAGKLTDDEMAVLRTHPTESYNMILDEGYSSEVLLAVRQHHERLDGSGYPDGLRAKDISLAARIVAVADVYDAMTSNKVYRKAETPFSVIEELFTEMFNKLDPHICSVFLQNLKTRLVGQRVSLPDGSEARVVHISGEGFGNPVLEDTQGKLIEFTAMSLTGIKLKYSGTGKPDKIADQER